MNRIVAITFLCCVIVYSATSQHLDNGESSLENNKENSSQRSGYIFKFLPTTTKKTPATANVKYKTTVSANEVDDGKSSNKIQSEKPTISIPSMSVRIATERQTEVKFSFDRLNRNDNDILENSESITPRPKLHQTSTTRSRFLFNIFSKLPTSDTPPANKNNDYHPSIAPRKSSRTNRPTASAVTNFVLSADSHIHDTSTKTNYSETIDEILNTVLSVTFDAEIPSTIPADWDSGNEFQGEIIVGDMAYTASSNVTEIANPKILVGYFPYNLEDWHWILIALLLFILLFLIPGFFCQVCISKRRKMKSSNTGKDDPDNDCESTQCETSNEIPIASPPNSAESVLSNHSAAKESNNMSSGEDVVEITIPTLTQGGATNQIARYDDAAVILSREISNKISNTTKDPPMPDTSDKYDIRVEIGNEVIIKSTDVTKHSADVMRTGPDEVVEIGGGKTRIPRATKHNVNRKRRKQREVVSQRKALPNHEERRGPHKKQHQTRRSRKVEHRTDTKAKISNGTKSILQAARDLDGILSAITNLTNEYPIPEHYGTTHQRSGKSVNTPNPKRRKPRIKVSDRADQNIRSDRAAKDRHKRNAMRAPTRERTRKSPHRRGERTNRNRNDDSKPRDKKLRQNRRKIPTLLKEELPEQDAAISEQRRQTLERALRKLQKYHNTQTVP